MFVLTKVTEVALELDFPVLTVVEPPVLPPLLPPLLLPTTTLPPEFEDEVVVTVTVPVFVLVTVITVGGGHVLFQTMTYSFCSRSEKFGAVSLTVPVCAAAS